MRSVLSKYEYYTCSIRYINKSHVENIIITYPKNSELSCWLSLVKKGGFTTLKKSVGSNLVDIECIISAKRTLIFAQYGTAVIFITTWVLNLIGQCIKIKLELPYETLNCTYNPNDITSLKVYDDGWMLLFNIFNLSRKNYSTYSKKRAHRQFEIQKTQFNFYQNIRTKTFWTFTAFVL